MLASGERFFSRTELPCHERRCLGISMSWSDVDSPCFVPFVFLGRGFFFERAMRLAVGEGGLIDTAVVLFVTR